MVAVELERFRARGLSRSWFEEERCEFVVEGTEEEIPVEAQIRDALELVKPKSEELVD